MAVAVAEITSKTLAAVLNTAASVEEDLEALLFGRTRPGDPPCVVIEGFLLAGAEGSLVSSEGAATPELRELVAKGTTRKVKPEAQPAPKRELKKGKREVCAKRESRVNAKVEVKQEEGPAIKEEPRDEAKKEDDAWRLLGWCLLRRGPEDRCCDLTTHARLLHQVVGTQVLGGAVLGYVVTCGTDMGEHKAHVIISHCFEGPDFVKVDLRCRSVGATTDAVAQDLRASHHVPDPEAFEAPTLQAAKALEEMAGGRLKSMLVQSDLEVAATELHGQQREVKRLKLCPGAEDSKVAAAPAASEAAQRPTG